LTERDKQSLLLCSYPLVEIQSLDLEEPYSLISMSFDINLERAGERSKTSNEKIMVFVSYLGSLCFLQE
jgi:hypothetical protein